MNQNLKTLESDAIRELSHDVESLKRRIETLNRSAEQQTNFFIKLQLNIQTKNLEADAANIEVNIAKKRYEVFDHVLRDWTIVADPQIQKEYSQLIVQQRDAFHVIDNATLRLGVRPLSPCALDR